MQSGVVYSTTVPLFWQSRPIPWWALGLFIFRRVGFFLISTTRFSTSRYVPLQTQQSAIPISIISPVSTKCRAYNLYTTMDGGWPQLLMGLWPVSDRFLTGFWPISDRSQTGLWPVSNQSLFCWPVSDRSAKQSLTGLRPVWPVSDRSLIVSDRSLTGLWPVFDRSLASESVLVKVQYVQ